MGLISLSIMRKFKFWNDFSMTTSIMSQQWAKWTWLEKSSKSSSILTLQYSWLFLTCVSLYSFIPVPFGCEDFDNSLKQWKWPRKSTLRRCSSARTSAIFGTLISWIPFKLTLLVSCNFRPRTQQHSLMMLNSVWYCFSILNYTQLVALLSGGKSSPFCFQFSSHGSTLTCIDIS